MGVNRGYSKQPDGSNGVWLVCGGHLFPNKAAPSFKVVGASLGACLLTACTAGPNLLSTPFTKAPTAGLSCAHHSGFKAASQDTEATQQRVTLGFEEVTRAQLRSCSGTIHAPHPAMPVAGPQTREGVGSGPEGSA